MNDYSDIIDYNYTGSKLRKKMSVEERAGQFSSFNALTGYSDMVKEKGRITSNKIELSDYEKSIINDKLNFLNDNINTFISIEYFVKDNVKEGGSYRVYDGIVKKIDTFNRCIVFDDKSKILFDDILDINIMGVDN